MLNSFGSQPDSGSYMNLKKRMLQRVQSTNINEQIVEVMKNALEAENVVLSAPERKRLFSQVAQSVLEDLKGKLKDGSIPV